MQLQEMEMASWMDCRWMLLWVLSTNWKFVYRLGSYGKYMSLEKENHQPRHFLFQLSSSFLLLGSVVAPVRKCMVLKIVLTPYLMLFFLYSCFVSMGRSHIYLLEIHRQHCFTGRHLWGQMKQFKMWASRIKSCLHLKLQHKPRIIRVSCVLSLIDTAAEIVLAVIFSVQMLHPLPVLILIFILPLSIYFLVVVNSLAIRVSSSYL